MCEGGGGGVWTALISPREPSDGERGGGFSPGQPHGFHSAQRDPVGAGSSASCSASKLLKKKKARERERESSQSGGPGRTYLTPSFRNTHPVHRGGRRVPPPPLFITLSPGFSVQVHLLFPASEGFLSANPAENMKVEHDKPSMRSDLTRTVSNPPPPRVLKRNRLVLVSFCGSSSSWFEGSVSVCGGVVVHLVGVATGLLDAWCPTPPPPSTATWILRVQLRGKKKPPLFFNLTLFNDDVKSKGFP